MTTPGPSNQTIHAWQETAPYWAKYSATITQMFAPLTESLIEEAGIKPRQTVLDVAGGAGEPSLTIAEKVGADGSVTCTDAVAEMVEAARAVGSDRHLTNINFQQCPACPLPFADNSFDVVVSRLGVMFFPDPLAAVREMLRVIRPGGTLALAVWGKSECNPYSYVVTNVMARHVQTPPADEDAPGAFRFAKPGKLAGILSAAGAAEVRERVFDFEIAAPMSPEEFWQLRSTISETVRTKLTQLSESLRAQIAAETLAAAREFFPNNQMRFPAQMLIVTGRKPKES